MQSLKVEYSNVVNDFSNWLATEKEVLDTIESSHNGANLDEIAHEWLRENKSTIDYYYSQLTSFDKKADEETRTELKKIYNDKLLRFIQYSPFNQRVKEKPLGYAGDWVLMKMILGSPYKNANNLFAKVMDGYSVRCDNALANHYRHQYLIRKLWEETQRTNSSNNKFRIFSIGCGPALELVEFLSNFPRLCRGGDILLLDIELEALEFAKANIEKTIQERNLSVTLSTRCANIIKFSRSSEFTDFVQKCDFIYSSGLFDYLSPIMAKGLVRKLIPRLKENALLLLTNAQVGNPSRIHMEYGGEWDMVYKTKNEFIQVLPKDVELSSCELEEDPFKIYMYLNCRK